MTTKAGCGAALIAGLCSFSAFAAVETEPIRLSYVADAGCPSAEDFQGFVLERTSRARPAGPGEIAREYRIRVRILDGKGVARLEFAATGGGSIVREVTAGECAEAVRAIAVVTALAFDAAVEGTGASRKDRDAPREGPAGAALPGTQAESPPPAGASPVRRTGSKPVTSPAAKPKPRAKEAALPRSEASPQRDTPHDAGRPRSPAPGRASPTAPSFALGARATVTSAKAPGVLPGAEIFGAITGRRPTWWVQIGIAGERGPSLESGPGKAQFSFVGGRLQGCFLGVALHQSVELSPCTLFEAGAVIAEGFIEEGRTVVDPWFALGLNARLAWDLGWSTALLEGGAYFPLRPEDRVVFGDLGDAEQHIVHDVDWIGGILSLGLAYRGP